MPYSPLLSITNLTAEYHSAQGTIRAVNDINLDIAAGEMVGIVGESGSGKSTLALAILGLLDAPGCVTSGSIRFEGHNVQQFDEASWQTLRGKHIGMIFQSPESSFNPTSTIGQQMREALQVHFGLSRNDAEAQAKVALRMVNMPHPQEVMENYAFELSGGMCQRAALALALSLRPKLLLADEPTASLDLLAQTGMARLFVDTQKTLGLTMLVISHDIGLIARIARRTVIMYAGRIVETGPTAQILSDPQHPYTRSLLAALPRLEATPNNIQVLAGNSPSLNKSFEGCAFAPRCNLTTPKCTTGYAPPLRLIADNCEVACHACDSLSHT